MFLGIFFMCGSIGGEPVTCTVRGGLVFPTEQACEDHAHAFLGEVFDLLDADARRSIIDMGFHCDPIEGSA